MKLSILQSTIEAVYPPQCVLCDARTATDFSLCGSCWRDTPFLDGLVCDACGCPLPGGDGAEDTTGLMCDDCMTIERPWQHGRAAMAYADLGRKIVMSLKHGDRTDLARAAGPWLARAAAPLLTENTVFVPIPLHWTRLLKRKFNQSALLAQSLSRLSDRPTVLEGLARTKRTKPLEGATREDRFRALTDAIAPHPKHGHQLKGKDVVLVDDVMTSGATFGAAAQACHAAGARQVCVLALARVTKDA